MSNTLKQLTLLRHMLLTRFDENELRTLCFDLGVDYDDLPAIGKSNKGRELIAYLERRSRIHELIRVGSEMRPDIDWSETSELAKESSAISIGTENESDIVTYNTPVLLRTIQGANVQAEDKSLLKASRGVIDDSMIFYLVNPSAPHSITPNQPVRYNEEISLKAHDMSFITIEQYSRGFVKYAMYFGFTQIFTLRYVQSDLVAAPITDGSRRASITDSNENVRYGDYFVLSYYISHLPEEIPIEVSYTDPTGASGIVWLNRKMAYKGISKAEPTLNDSAIEPNIYNIFYLAKPN